MLYIFWLLHQTTTWCLIFKGFICCISFDSYIKPQPEHWTKEICPGCISFDSYIKPQLQAYNISANEVVYLLTPTSNHNLTVKPSGLSALYIFWLLHQTTTRRYEVRNHQQLYIFWLLHQTTTGPRPTSIFLSCISFDSYIKPQLAMLPFAKGSSCISFDSYIKPQPKVAIFSETKVVYLLTPTSNHNLP